MKPYLPCQTLSVHASRNTGTEWREREITAALTLFGKGANLERICHSVGRQPQEVMFRLWCEGKLTRKPKSDTSIGHDYFLKEVDGEMGESDTDGFVEASLDSKDPVTYTLEMVEDLLLSSWMTGSPVKDGPLLRKIVQQRLEKVK